MNNIRSRLDELSSNLTRVEKELEEIYSKHFAIRSARKELMAELSSILGEGGEADHIRDQLLTVTKQEAQMDDHWSILDEEKMRLEHLYGDLKKDVLNQGEDK